MSGDRLPGVRAAFIGALQANADLLYTRSGTWSDGTTCAYSVTQPSKTAEGTRRAQALTGEQNVLDIRFLKVRPGDPLPAEGATLAGHEGGVLALVSWSDRGSLSGQAVAVCRFSR